MSPIFYLLAALTVGGAVASMAFRNPVHCVLSLVVTFAGLAGVYLGLGAQFLGLAQVLVYVGAVAILVVFVLLLTRQGTRADGGSPRGGRGWIAGLAVAIAVGTVLAAAVVSGPAPGRRTEAPKPPSVRDTGVALMTEFVLPLQAVGVLLTAAMIGAAVLALRERPVGRRPGSTAGSVVSGKEAP